MFLQLIGGDIVKKRYSKRLMQTKLEDIETILDRITSWQTAETTFEALKNAGQFDVRHLMHLFHLNRREAKLILEAVEFFEEII